VVINMDVMKHVMPVMREPAPVQESAAQGGICVPVSPEIVSHRPEPKRYLDATRREALFREGGMNAVYAAESRAADNAGDGDASWAWLAMGELPADALRFLKRRHGAAFIRLWGFSTRHADEAYGADWLERE
jgi:hypothetical protein